MPRTNYARGRSAEQRAKQELERVGYRVVRAAGSHGDWDIVAVRPGSVRLIQIKSGERESDVRRACEAAIEVMQVQGFRSGQGLSFEAWGWVHGEGWCCQWTA